MSGWNGIWIAEGMEAQISGRGLGLQNGPFFKKFLTMRGDGAPWNAVGLSRYEDTVRLGLQGGMKQHGWAFPVMMNTYAPLTFVIAPNQTAIISQYREVRQIYTDGRSHQPAEDRWPTTYGDSIGCWKDGTLTIETVSVGYDPKFNFWAPNVSGEAVYIERLRLVADGRIEGDLTIADPATLTKPWTIHLAFVRHPHLERLIFEGDIFDNDRNQLGNGAGTITPAKAEDVGPPVPLHNEPTLSDTELDRLVGDYAIEGAAPGTIFHVERRGNRLWWGGRGPVLPPLPLHVENALHLYLRPLDAAFEFDVGATGKVTQVKGHFLDEPFTAKPIRNP